MGARVPPLPTPRRAGKVTCPRDQAEGVRGGEQGRRPQEGGGWSRRGPNLPTPCPLLPSKPSFSLKLSAATTTSQERASKWRKEILMGTRLAGGASLSRGRK